MKLELTRREMLRLTAGAGALMGASTLGGCSLFERLRNRPRRRDIATLAPDHPDLVTYRAAVKAMKALPDSNPRSWSAQAKIHLEHCPHGNWFFLPWHRAYLYYFEQICCELTGNNDFGLPYWNWQKNRKIPNAFWGSSSNPLRHSPRFATSSSQAAAWAVGANVIEDILDEPNFFVFGSGPAAAGKLEGTPHNHIHGFVGGTMSTYDSPLDPIFWCHHNMVECLWVEWNRRGHGNPNDSTWTKHIFNGQFVNGQGDLIEDLTVESTLLMPIFGYRYESPTKGKDPSGTITNRQLEGLLERGAKVEVQVLERFDLDGELRIGVGQAITRRSRVSELALEQSLKAGVAGRQEGDRLFLIASGLQPPENEDYFVHVYVGEVDDPPADPLEDPRYAGSFSFFTDPESPHHDHPQSFRIDLTDTLRQLSDSGNQTEEIAVTLAPGTLEGREVQDQTFAARELRIERSRVTPSAPVIKARGR